MIEAIPIIVETDLLDVIAAAEKKPVIVSGGREGHTRPIRDVHVAADPVGVVFYELAIVIGQVRGVATPILVIPENGRSAAKTFHQLVARTSMQVSVAQRVERSIFLEHVPAIPDVNGDLS